MKQITLTDDQAESLRRAVQEQILNYKDSLGDVQRFPDLHKGQIKSYTRHINQLELILTIIDQQ